MVGRGELTEAAWEQVAPLLPENGQRGKQWQDHRRVINGILWRLRTGAPWRDLPERYGPWQTVYDRFTRWRCDGTWDRLLAQVQTRSDAVGEVVWEVSIDATVVRAHQHAAGARRRPAKRELPTTTTTHAVPPPEHDPAQTPSPGPEGKGGRRRYRRRHWVAAVVD